MKHAGGADRGDGVIICRGNKDLRKITCPRCHSVATTTRTADGKVVARCHGCGAVFSTKSI